MAFLQSCCVNETMLHVALVTQMGIYSLPVTWNIAWHRLMKVHFIQHHTFQHCSYTFKLHEHGKCLNLIVNNQQTWLETNSSFLTCIKPCKCIALSLVLSVISSFPQHLRCEADIVLPHSTLLATLLCLGIYEQCCT